MTMYAALNVYIYMSVCVCVCVCVKASLSKVSHHIAYKFMQIYSPSTAGINLFISQHSVFVGFVYRILTINIDYLLTRH